jgi:hypothetical protein
MKASIDGDRRKDVDRRRSYKDPNPKEDDPRAELDGAARVHSGGRGVSGAAAVGLPR